MRDNGWRVAPHNKTDLRYKAASLGVSYAIWMRDRCNALWHFAVLKHSAASAYCRAVKDADDLILLEHLLPSFRSVYGSAVIEIGAAK
jgi:hypothetical protein